MDKSLFSQGIKLVDYYLPGNAIDCVILGYEDQQLKTLLLQWKDEKNWCLPGGFIHNNENMDQAAHRILIERTGLKSVFLNQFHTFGDKDRSKTNGAILANKIEELLKRPHANNQNIINWISQRFITTGYFGLVDIRKTSPKPDFLSETCEWRSLTDLPNLMMDHEEIITKSLEHLRIQLNYLPLGISLLPKKFTMQDLQKLYESILSEPLERSNFQRKMLKLGVLMRLEKQMTGAANKAPYLYCFDRSKYNELTKKGIGFTH